MADPLTGAWYGLGELRPITLVCGYCDHLVGAHKGWFFQEQTKGNEWATIRVCPNCQRPSYLEGGQQIPGPKFGASIHNVPPNIDAVYNEARSCTSANAHTSAVLTCRKILMHIAVNKGAELNCSFWEYVQYLSDQGYVPPDGKGWVDYIRQKGNEANHEIVIMSKQDAERLLAFLEMLLNFIYEFPSRVPTTPGTATAT